MSDAKLGDITVRITEIYFLHFYNISESKIVFNPDDDDLNPNKNLDNVVQQLIRLT